MLENGQGFEIKTLSVENSEYPSIASIQVFTYLNVEWAGEHNGRVKAEGILDTISILVIILQSEVYLMGI